MVSKIRRKKRKILKQALMKKLTETYRKRQKVSNPKAGQSNKCKAGTGTQRRAL